MPRRIGTLAGPRGPRAAPKVTSAARAGRMCPFAACAKLLAGRAPVAIHAKGAEDRAPLAALVGRPDRSAVLLCARDLRIARRVDVERAGDRHVGAEAIPAIRVGELD